MAVRRNYGSEDQAADKAQKGSQYTRTSKHAKIFDIKYSQLIQSKKKNLTKSSGKLGHRKQ